jgi:ribosomal-protein-alanine N-acetyltransferase
MIPFLEKPRVDIEIRRAIAGDLKDIMEIEEASFTTPWPSDVMINEITANPFSEVMVALHEKKVVSFMICWVVNCERHLQNIATAPAWRSRGVARMLMDHLIHEAQYNAPSVINLEVRELNREASGLYYSLGFAETGRKKGYYSDTGEDAVLMLLNIEKKNPGRQE